MLEKIIDWSIRNKFMVVLVTLFIVISGGYALKNIPLDAIPDLSDVQVIVFTQYPGQAPQVVEDQVTYPLTTKMLSVPGSKVVRGYSFFGYSFVYIIFEDGTDIYWARSRVLEYLNYVSGQLPKGVTPVLGPDATGVGWVFEYALESDHHNLQELRSIQDWYLRYELTSVEGVSEVASLGGFVKQYQVAVDPNKLLAYNIPISELMMAIQRNNLDVGGGAIESAETEYVIRSFGYIKSVEDIRNIVVMTTPAGTPILVRDLAEVRLGPEMRRGVAELDGQGETVGGIIVMRFGENALKTIDNVKRKLEELRGRPARGGDDQNRLRPLRPDRAGRGHPQGEAAGGEHRGRPGDHALSLPPAQRLCRHLHPAGGHPDGLYPHVRPGDQRQHHEPGRHRHRHRRHDRRGHHHDRKRPQTSGTRPGQKTALADHPGRGQGGRADPLLLAAGHHRLLCAGLHPAGAVGPHVQAAGLHQDLCHGRRGPALHHHRPGAHGLVHPRQDQAGTRQSDQPPAASASTTRWSIWS